MTKVIDLTKEKTKFEKIEFCFWLDENIRSNRGKYSMLPSDYEEVFLIGRNYTKINNIYYDLIYARDRGKLGSLYFGHFNDGIV